LLCGPAPAVRIYWDPRSRLNHRGALRSCQPPHVYLQSLFALAFKASANSRRHFSMGFLWALPLTPGLFQVSKTGLLDLLLKALSSPEVGPPKVGPSEVGPPEVSAPEVGPLEVGASEVGPLEVSPLEVGPSEVSLLEVGLLKVGPPEVGQPEVSPLEVGLLELSPQKIGPLELGFLKVGLLKVGLKEVGPLEVGPRTDFHPLVFCHRVHLLSVADLLDRPVSSMPF